MPPWVRNHQLKHVLCRRPLLGRLSNRILKHSSTIPAIVPFPANQPCDVSDADPFDPGAATGSEANKSIWTWGPSRKWRGSSSCRVATLTPGVWATCASNVPWLSYLAFPWGERGASPELRNEVRNDMTW